MSTYLHPADDSDEEPVHAEQQSVCLPTTVTAASVESGSKEQRIASAETVDALSVVWADWLSLHQHELSKLFRSIDTDRDGFLSASEVLGAVSGLSGADDRVYQAVMALADSDGDGRISRDEWFAFVVAVQERVVDKAETAMKVATVEVTAADVERWRSTPEPKRRWCSCMLYCDPNKCPQPGYDAAYKGSWWERERMRLGL